jgi:hypothetical protein
MHFVGHVLMASSSGSDGGEGTRVTRRDRSFVVYVWSKGTHSCIHPFVYFLRRESGGFPSRMLTRWASVRDDQGRASNSRSILLICVAVSPIRLAVAGHLRKMWVSSPRACWWQYTQWRCWYSCRPMRPEKCKCVGIYWGQACVLSLIRSRACPWCMLK